MIKQDSRWPAGVLLALLFAFLGLFVGTVVGGFLVPEGSGLAGPAIALGYGLFGACLAVVAAVLLAMKLTLARLRRVLLVTGTLAVLALGFLVYRLMTLPPADTTVSWLG